MLLILATSWLDLPSPGQKEIQILELFAGQARLSRLGKSLGLAVAAHDLGFDVSAKTSPTKRSAMDINGNGGFTFFGLLLISSSVSFAFSYSGLVVCGVLLE